MERIIIYPTALLVIITVTLMFFGLVFKWQKSKEYKKFPFAIGLSSLIAALLYAIQIPFNINWFSPYGAVIWLVIAALFLFVIGRKKKGGKDV